VTGYSEPSNFLIYFRIADNSFPLAGFLRTIKIACMIRTTVLLGCCLPLSATAVILNAQSNPAPPSHPLPYVSSMAVPFYPPIARAANMQGIVHIRVTTNGSRVVATHVEDGPKLLADGAEKNVKTWEFAGDHAATFSVAYTFRFAKNPTHGFIRETVVLRLPTQIEVMSPPNPPLDSSGAKPN